MTGEERVLYPGNVVHVAGVDGEVSPREGEAIEQVRREMGAQDSPYDQSAGRRDFQSRVRAGGVSA